MYRAPHGDAQTPPLVWAKKADMHQRKRSWTFPRGPKGVILIRVLLAASNRQITRLRSFITLLKEVLRWASARTG